MRFASRFFRAYTRSITLTTSPDVALNEGFRTAERRERPTVQRARGGILRRLSVALALGGALAASSCSNPTPQIRLTQSQGREQQTFEEYDAIKTDASLVGRSFVLELRDEKNEPHRARISLARPSANRVELTIDGKTYALDDGDLQKLLDVKKHKKGVALVGKTDIQIMPTAEALVELEDLKRSLERLRVTQDANPALEVPANIPFRGKQIVRFSAAEVKPKAAE